jgi:uncharacterized protein (TIGR02246 family)
MKILLKVGSSDMNKILILAVALALSGCSNAQPKTDPKADKEAVEKIRDAFTEAFNDNDAVKVGSIYSENAVMMNNGQPTAHGRAAITESNKMLFDQFTGKITLSPQNTKVSGDLAFDEGTFMTVMTPKAGDGKPVTDEGRYIVILQREKDGWKVIEDIGNVSKAPASNPVPTKKPAAAKKAPAKAPATKTKTKTR